MLISDKLYPVLSKVNEDSIYKFCKFVLHETPEFFCVIICVTWKYYYWNWKRLKLEGQSGCNFPKCKWIVNVSVGEPGSKTHSPTVEQE